MATKKTTTDSRRPATPASRSSGARSKRPAAGDERPPARSSSAARPRIRATHAESRAVEREDAKPASKADQAKRRARAAATVRALDGGAARPGTRRVLPAPSARKPDAMPKRRASLPPSAPSSEARELALAIAGAGLEKKAVGVEVIDVSGRVDYADFIVIMTGTSDRHVHAIAMGIEGSLKKRKRAPLSVEGLGSAAWVLIDFDDVVVHVFQEDTRSVYDIEGLWTDASRVAVPPEAPAGRA